MTESERPPGAREEILHRLSGWYDPALSREVEVVLNGDRYNECPLKAAGFTLERFSELGAIIIGPDGKCICTYKNGCMNVDKRDGMRCTRQQLEQLNCEAGRRRAWQSGGD
ncbi:MAG: hypothetical protein ACREGR_02060 [Minisyncoccia bacterium]